MTRMKTYDPEIAGRKMRKIDAMASESWVPMMNQANSRPIPR
nr:hypothetical protein [Candidatus Sigynarchaeota archaeon]